MIENLEKKTNFEGQDKKWEIKNGIIPCIYKITLNTKEKFDRDRKEHNSMCTNCNGYNNKCPHYTAWDVQ